VPAKNVGRGKFFRDPLLTGIDQRRFRDHGLDLADMLGFGGIAEDDSHTGFLAGTGRS
jgi:hypothetical protein